MNTVEKVLVGLFILLVGASVSGPILVAKSIKATYETAKEERVAGNATMNDYKSVFRTSSSTLTANTSKRIVEANPSRSHLMITNGSGAPVWLGFTTGSTTIGTGYWLSTTTPLVLDANGLYTGAIEAISASAVSVAIIEG